MSTKSRSSRQVNSMQMEWKGMLIAERYILNYLEQNLLTPYMLWNYIWIAVRLTRTIRFISNI